LKHPLVVFTGLHTTSKIKSQIYKEGVLHRISHIIKLKTILKKPLSMTKIFMKPYDAWDLLEKVAGIRKPQKINGGCKN